MWLMICKQLMNRWRSSLSVGLELLLVFCLAWFLMDYFFVEGYNRSLPAGRSCKNVWLVELGLLPENAREYVAAESDSANLPLHYARVLERLRAYPGVTGAGASYNCASLPYSPCYNGKRIRNVADTARTIGCMAMWFDPATDFLAVFAHRRAADGQLVSTTDFDWGDPRAVLITRQMERTLFGEASAVGKLITDEDDPADNTAHRRVAGVLEDVKRLDNDLPRGVILFPKRPDPAEIPEMNYFIRTDGTASDARFAAAFMERMSRELRVGNFFLKRLTPYHRYKADMEYAFGTTYEYRTRLALLAFLCVNILLCVIGTFWYRVRTRRGEIGLRRAIGSGSGQVRGMLFREGIVLLMMVTPFALLIEAQVMLAGLVDLPYGPQIVLPDNYWPAMMPLRFLLVNAAVWLLLAAAILAGIWLPATRAAEMEPAEALRYDG